MSSVETASRWLERATDWMNPILVKEVRQALKSRQFVITFLLLLVGAWLISVFGILNAGDALEYGATGHAFFAFYYCVLATAIFVIVPYNAFRSLLTEREQNTFELVSITTLSPRRIVWGKLLSAMVQVFIYYSAIAPFIAFTSLLQGFDLAQVVFLLSISLLASMGCSMITIMLSTVAKQKTWQALISLAVLGGLVWLIMVVYSMTAYMLAEPIPFDDPDFWWGLSFFVAGGISYFVLALQITAAQLTFESGNRSTGIRITCAAQFWLLWFAVIAYSVLSGSWSSFSRSDLIGFSVISAIHWSVVGLFTVTESDFLSRRIRRRLPQRRLWRFLIAPFLPGGNRGWCYLLLHILALWLVAFMIWSLYMSRSSEFISFLTALCCYVVIYLGMGCAMGQLARRFSADVKPAHVRVFILLLFAVGVVTPYLPYALGLMKWQYGYSLIYITNPFVTLDQLSDRGSRMDSVVFFLVAVAGASVLLNARAMIHGVADVARVEKKGLPRSENT